jgi:hypothetical protein
MLKPQDAERAVAALSRRGHAPEDRPRSGCVKAWDGDTLVDLIYLPKGMPVDDA